MKNKSSQWLFNRLHVLEKYRDRIWLTPISMMEYDPGIELASVEDEWNAIADELESRGCKVKGRGKYGTSVLDEAERD